MNKKDTSKSEVEGLQSISLLGKYSDLFELLDIGKTITLGDSKSKTNSYIPIKVNDNNVYLTEPDGKLIPDIKNQQKCDYLIYCLNKPQTCFIELKGNNISIKEKYNPYDQISDTIDFLKKEDELRNLVESDNEKHAFIVSPDRQKIPKGVDIKERQLWKKLSQAGIKSNVSDLVHYVKVTKSERYSNNGSIICSHKSPVEIPFNR